MSVEPKEPDKELDKAAFRILATLRDAVGMERSLELAMEVIFLLWRTGPEEAKAASRLSVEHGNVDHLVSALERNGCNPDAAASLRSAPPNPILSLLKTIDEVLSRGIALPAIAEALIGEYVKVGSRVKGEHFTPSWLSKFLADLVGSGEIGGDPACGGGSGLLALAESCEVVDGEDLHHGSQRLAHIRLAMTGARANIRHGDSLLNTRVNTARFDVVTCVPPWGYSLMNEQRESLIRDGIPKALLRRSGRNVNVLWAFLASRMLRSGGRAAVVMPQIASFASEALDLLLDEGRLEAVIALPSGILGATSAPAQIWLLRPPTEARRSILMVDTSPLAGFHSRHRNARLSADTLTQVMRIIELFRATGAVEAETHIATATPCEDLGKTTGVNPVAFLDESPEAGGVVPEPSGHLLQSLSISGYKSYGRATKIDLAPITLVYGPNSSGKSSLIQSLLLLRQSLDEPRLVTQGPVADVGSFTGVRHRHEAPAIEFTLTFGAPVWSLPEEGTPDPSKERHLGLHFRDDGGGRGHLAEAKIAAGPLDAVWRRTDKGMEAATDSLSDTFAELGVGTFLYPRDSRHVRDVSAEEAHERDKRRREHGRRQARQLERMGIGTLEADWPGLLPSGLARALPSGHLDDRAMSVLQSYVDRTAILAAGVGRELRSILEDLVYLGPLRSSPQRFYSRNAAPGLPGDGREAAMYLFDNPSATEEVNRWFHELEIPYSMDVIPLHAGPAAELIGDLVAISLRDLRSDVLVSPVDVGYGISQIMPIVLELTARSRSVICVEQPETHLHPRLQARLGDLLIDTVRPDGNANQVLVETHSEHLVLRLQRRVREGDLDPESVSVLYVDQDEGGVAVARRLRLDKDGDFVDEWPGGFFDERLDELFGDLA